MRPLFQAVADCSCPASCKRAAQHADLTKEEECTIQRSAAYGSACAERKFLRLLGLSMEQGITYRQAGKGLSNICCRDFRRLHCCGGATKVDEGIVYRWAGVVYLCSQA